MSESQEGFLSPQTVLDQLKKNGITHVLWLPDSETNWLYTLMKAEPSITLVPVTREGLAFSGGHRRRRRQALHPDSEHGLARIG
jgi:hypothetical protein